MKIRPRVLISFAVLAFFFVAVFLMRQPPTSFGQETIPSSRVPACGCYKCGELLAINFPNQAARCAGILAADACPSALPDQGMSESQRKAFCASLRGGLSSDEFKSKCPAYGEMCPDEPEPNCEKYTGEITCDCNGDGTDDATRTFESCSTTSNFPRQFKSRCEQWATGDGGFSYSTDIRIQRAGQEWLGSISCPALDCHQKYAACTGPLETNLQKCLTGNRLIGSRRRCQAYYTTAKTRCEKARTACLNGLRRFGPAPVPQAVPTPTPSGGSFSRISLGIFDPAFSVGEMNNSTGPCIPK